MTAIDTRASLHEFLLARVAEDEAKARSKRARAECEMKRQLIERHRFYRPPPCVQCGWEDDPLKWLGSLYADHPDYRNEWRQRQ